MQSFSSEKSDTKGEKNIDENNFLNQIRTKVSCSVYSCITISHETITIFASPYMLWFQLMSLRPTLPSGISTNVQGMTILDKANAIRKVVNSHFSLSLSLS